ncbi:RNA-binding protein Nrd1 [Schizophyllum amplum]|uniref:RNA-binding protein Nrd1 n=1 Tax=Schizophyllum amplum TaxID=97359 RepID=A0A550CVP4_9AGAR|nr:RNA-binding protein Nrd1 [Auriculariopsis ampla]
MDDSQTAFANQYPSSYSTFDLDMMKRSMDAVGGPDAKKARWSPNSFANGNPASPSVQDAFANYGYGPQAALAQQGYPNGSPGNTYSSNHLYNTPTLTINTQSNGVGMASQLSPNTAVFGQPQTPNPGGQPSPNGSYNFGGMYNMLGMGMPGMLGGFYGSQMANFAQPPYSPIALSAALAGGSNQPVQRTVYIGNLPSTASVDELLNLVHFGPLESIRVLPDKSCVFLSFLDAQTAGLFHADATVKKLALHGQELKIGWGKPSTVPQQVALAISQSNASRNVYLGGLDEGLTEEQLRNDLQRFGLIDQVKIVRDKNIGFVHFLSISVATKVVNTLPTEPAWAGKRVNYGKDRCAYVPKSQQAAAQNAQAFAAQTIVANQAMNSPASAGFYGGFPNAPDAGNRTVYIGNIHPETTTEDLCNAIRGGMLQTIRYMQDKHIAFVTFVDTTAAYTFYNVSSYQGLTLNNRRLKIGWGKNSGPLSPSLAVAVHSGATRNVYIGNIEDFETFTDDRLKRDFGEYGDIELVNFLKEKNCAFVNFTNIANAIKAIEAIKNKPEYSNLRIAHGKDRCANPPRSGPQGGAGKHHRHGHGHGNNQTNGTSAGSDNGTADGMKIETPDINIVKEEPTATGIVAAA